MPDLFLQLFCTNRDGQESLEPCISELNSGMEAPRCDRTQKMQKLGLLSDMARLMLLQLVFCRQWLQMMGSGLGSTRSSPSQ